MHIGKEVSILRNAAKEKPNCFGKIFYHNIPINDFSDYVRRLLKYFHNAVTLQTEQKAKNIFNTMVASSAVAERLLKNERYIYTDISSCLTVENVAKLITILLLFY